MSPSIDVRILGPFVVRDQHGGVAGPWSRPSARRLVQLLSLAPDRRLLREEIAEVLAPRLAPARSANAVAKALSLARSAVGRIEVDPASFLLADRTSIRLAGPELVRIDLDEHLAALRAGLALPPGDARDAALAAALADASGLLDDEPFEDWAIRARDALAARRLEAWIALARDRDAGHGRSAPDDVIDASAGVAAREPASEEAAIGLIRGYVARGQRDRAIRTYLRTAAELREGLGVEPSPELEAARAELDALAARPGPAAATTGPLEPRPLVGRSPVLRRLERALDRTEAGRGPAIVLVGPAGVGKTHLAGTLAAGRRQAGWTVVGGTAVPGDERIPYAALGTALRSLADTPGGSPASARRGSGSDDRPPVAGGWLERLVGGGDVEGAAGGGGEAGLAAIAGEVGRRLDETATDRPLLLVIDDLHWADRALVALLRRLAAGHPQRRWAMLVVARSDEPHHPPPSLGSAAEVVEVLPLAEAATRSAVRRALVADGTRPHRDDVAAAVRASRGNAFFAIELARSLSAARATGGPTRASGAATGVAPVAGSGVPEAIVALLRDRLAALTPAARTMLPLVAVAGPEATFEVLLGAADRLAIPARDAHRGLEELLETRQVVETGDRLALVHPLLRDAALASTNALRRGTIHGAIADDLAAVDPTLGGGLRDAVATHRLAAFEATRLRAHAGAAARAGFAAGQRARRLLAIEAAGRLLEGALAAYDVLVEPDRTDLRREAVRAWVTIGDLALDRDDDAAAETAYRTALARAATDDERSVAWAGLGGIRYRHGDLAGAAAVLEEGLASISGDDALARARLQSDLGFNRLRMGSPEVARSLLEAALPVVIAGDDVALRCRTRDRYSLIVARDGQPADAVALLDEALRDAIEHQPVQELVLRLHRSTMLEDLGRTDEAAEDVAIAARLADAAGDSYLRSVIHWTWADMLAGRGEPELALAERDREVALLVRLDNPRNLARAQLHRATLLLDLGRRRAAAEALLAARAAARRVDDPGFATAFAAEVAEIGSRLGSDADRAPAGVGGKSSGTAPA